LKRTAALLSVAEYTFTGIETSPKLSESDAIERKATPHLGPPPWVATVGGRRAPA